MAKNAKRPVGENKVDDREGIRAKARGAQSWVLQSQASGFLGELISVELRLRYAKCRARIDGWESKYFSRYTPLGKMDFDALGYSTVTTLGNIWREMDSCISATQGASFESNDVAGEDVQGIMRAECRTLGAWCLMLLDKLKASLVWLQQAECGLREEFVTHRLVLARICRTRAAVLMVSADKSLRRKWQPECVDPVVEKLLGEESQGRKKQIPLVRKYDRELSANYCKASQALDRAKNELTRSEMILQTAGRHVRTWRRLFEQQAQLAFEMLLLLAVETDFVIGEKKEDVVLRGTVVQHLNTGLAAVRSIVDCSEAEDESRRYSGAVKWIALMIAGYILLACRSVEPPFVDGQTRRSVRGSRVEMVFRMNSFVSESEFMSLWTFLNRSAGLGEFVESSGKLLGALFAWPEDHEGDHDDESNGRTLERIVRSVKLNDHRFIGGLDGEPKYYLREFILQKTIDVLKHLRKWNGALLEIKL
jgi:hypothetical protein